MTPRLQLKFRRAVITLLAKTWRGRARAIARHSHDQACEHMLFLVVSVIQTLYIPSFGLKMELISGIYLLFFLQYKIINLI